MRPGKHLELAFNRFKMPFIDPEYLSINNTGIYKIDYYNGCDTLFFNVEAKETEDCICHIYIPNAFSPNAKAPNDTFFIIVDCDILEQSFEVYNRWGQKIFESNEKVVWAMPNVPIGVYLYKWSAVLLNQGQRKNVFETSTIQVLK